LEQFYPLGILVAWQLITGRREEIKMFSAGGKGKESGKVNKGNSLYLKVARRREELLF